MGEMIVVKQYDQMDALNQLLNSSARKHTNMIPVEEYNALEVADSCEEDVNATSVDNWPNVDAAPEREPNLKRKRDEAMDDIDLNREQSIECNQKRRKLSTDQKLTETEEPVMTPGTSLSPDLSKENIPPECNVSPYQTLLTRRVKKSQVE